MCHVIYIRSNQTDAHIKRSVRWNILVGLHYYYSRPGVLLGVIGNDLVEQTVASEFDSYRGALTSDLMQN